MIFYEECCKEHLPGPDRRIHELEHERDAYYDSAISMLNAFPVDPGDWPVDGGEDAVAALRQWFAEGAKPDDWGDDIPPDSIVGIIAAQRIIGRREVMEVVEKWIDELPIDGNDGAPGGLDEMSFSRGVQEAMLFCQRELTEKLTTTKKGTIDTTPA